MPSPSQLQWEPIAREAANEAGIDECIFVALINQESTWNPSAQNGNCYGIAQINPQYHFVDPWDAESSLFYAARLLKAYKEEGGSYEQALGAYNWGASNMRGNGWIVPGNVMYAFVNPIMAAAGRCTPMERPTVEVEEIATEVPEPTATVGPQATAMPLPLYIYGTSSPVAVTTAPPPSATATPTPTPPLAILGLLIPILWAIWQR